MIYSLNIYILKGKISMGCGILIKLGYTRLDSFKLMQLCLPSVAKFTF